MFYLDRLNCFPLLYMADSAQNLVGSCQIVGLKLLPSELQRDRIEAALYFVDRVDDLTELDRLWADAPEGFPVFRE